MKLSSNPPPKKKFAKKKKKVISIGVHPSISISGINNSKKSTPITVVCPGTGRAGGDKKNNSSSITIGSSLSDNRKKALSAAAEKDANSDDDSVDSVTNKDARNTDHSKEQHDDLTSLGSAKNN